MQCPQALQEAVHLEVVKGGYRCSHNSELRFGADGKPVEYLTHGLPARTSYRHQVRLKPE